MQLTEAEARQHWCPFVRHAVEGGTAASNRGGGGDLTLALCVGSYCMMWRWLQEEPVARKPSTFWWDGGDDELDDNYVPPRPAEVPADWVWRPVIRVNAEEWEGGYWEEPADQVAADNAATRAARKGCCGLAWRPDL